MKKELTVIDEESCCTPAALPSLSKSQAQNMAALLAALADPTRLAIVSLLAAQRNEVCVCDITASFDLGQPTISHHLKILREAGLVTTDKRGKWVYYGLVQSKLAEVQAMFESLRGELVLV